MTTPTDGTKIIAQQVLEKTGLPPVAGDKDLREKIAALPQDKKDRLRHILDRDHDGFLDVKETKLVATAAIGRSVWNTSDNNRALGKSNGQLEELQRTYTDPKAAITPQEILNLHQAMGEAFGGYGHYESMDKHTASSIARGMNEHVKRQINDAVGFDRDFGVGEASPAAEPDGHTVPSAKPLEPKGQHER